MSSAARQENAGCIAGVAPPVLIMAGGTGGHVFPALAVADELLARGRRLVWLGTRGGSEVDWLKGRDFPLELVYAAGVRGGGLRRLLKGLLCCTLGLLQALRVIRRYRPAVALGMGGYASVPGGAAAWLLGVPLCIHEQNVMAGLANRVLARFASRRLQGFPGCLAGAETTGNPVRPAFFSTTRAAPDGAHFRLLVLGGSRGSRALNQLLPEALASIAAKLPLEVLHQCGEGMVAGTRQRYSGVQAHVRVESFIKDMAAAYSWADLAVCRAGALTLAELSATGLAAVLIPYPHAGSHQLANARFFAGHGGAVVLPQAGLTAERLAAALLELADDRARLARMGEQNRRLARPDAAIRIADTCIAVAGAEQDS